MLRLTTRPVKLKPCLVATCSAMVPTRGNKKRCDPCQRLKWRREAARAMAKRQGKQIWEVEVAEQSFDIEARFQAALKEIRRTPRELMLGWSSPLARL